jgi:hypothetical protein
MALRAAELDEDAMLDGSVGQALSLRGPHRPASTVSLCVFNGGAMAVRATEGDEDALLWGRPSACAGLPGPQVAFRMMLLQRSTPWPGGPPKVMKMGGG